MKIDETIHYFSELKAGAAKTADQRRYSMFASLLQELKEKDTSGEHDMVIERKLDEIQPQFLSPEDRKSAMRNFKKFLMKSLRYVPVNYFTTLGMGLGMSIGSALGISIGVSIDRMVGIALGVSIGIGFGLTIGLLLGRNLDKKARAENRVLDNLRV